MLRRLLDWWCVDRPLQALGRPGVHSKTDLILLNAFYHTSRAQLGPILAIYPLVLSCKEELFLRG